MRFIQKWYKLIRVSVDECNGDLGIKLFVIFFHSFKEECKGFIILIKIWMRDKDIEASHKKIFDLCEILLRCGEFHQIVMILELDEVFSVVFWNLSLHVKVIIFIRKVQKGRSSLNKTFFFHGYVGKVILETIPFDIHETDSWNRALNQYKFTSLVQD